MAYQAAPVKSRSNWFEQRPRLLWILATGLGYIVGSFLVGLVFQISLIGFSTPALWTYSILSIAGTGAFVGLAQGLVLQRLMHVRIMLAWVLATAIGSALGAGALLTSSVLYANLAISLSCIPCGSLLFILIPGAILGSLVGYAQRRVLEIHLDEAPKWVQINVLAAIVALLPLSFGLIWVFVGLIGGGLDLSNVWIIGILSGWLPPFLYGTITSGAAARMIVEANRPATALSVTDVPMPQ